TQVQINATSAKLVGRRNTPAHICEALEFQVPKFRWSRVSAPSGQSATFAGATTLSPGVAVGGPGAYRIRLTACPNNCILRMNGKSKTVGPLTRDLTIN